MEASDLHRRLYRNLGNWRFEDVTSKWGIGGDGFGMGVAVGDYDNDGRPDLYVTAVGRNFLYRNTGSKLVEVASCGRRHGDRDGRRERPFSTTIAMVIWICSSPAISIGILIRASGAARVRELRARTAIPANSAKCPICFTEI